MTETERKEQIDILTAEQVSDDRNDYALPHRHGRECFEFPVNPSILANYENAGLINNSYHGYCRDDV